MGLLYFCKSGVAVLYIEVSGLRVGFKYTSKAVSGVLYIDSICGYCWQTSVLFAGMLS